MADFGLVQILVVRKFVPYQFLTVLDFGHMGAMIPHLSGLSVMSVESIHSRRILSKDFSLSGNWYCCILSRSYDIGNQAANV